MNPISASYFGIFVVGVLAQVLIRISLGHAVPILVLQALVTAGICFWIGRWTRSKLDE